MNVKKHNKIKKKTIGFDDLNDKLDRVIDTMATKEDLLVLEERLDQKIGTVDRKVDSLDKKFSTKFQELFLMTEGLMKPISELKMEYTGMMIQLSRHEEWIKLLAKKNGVKLPM